MITLQDVLDSRPRISPYILRTPLQYSDLLSEQLGTNVYLKLELFQKTGSFKPRGTFNQMLSLSQEERDRGVVAVSGGNFAQAVAYGGHVLGIQTLVCMPETTPKNYVDFTRAYGAQIEFAPDVTASIQLAESYQQQGKPLVHPFDNPYMMAGNGTLGLEILEDLPQLNGIFISVGGGGLIGGNIVSIKALKPDVRIWAVETRGADAMGQALQAGKVVHIRPTSLAKTLGSPYLAEDTLILAQQHLEGHILVTDQEAYLAELTLLERSKVLTELAASCTLAAAGKVKSAFKPDDTIVLLLCGGNISLETLQEYQRLFGEPGNSH